MDDNFNRPTSFLISITAQPDNYNPKNCFTVMASLKNGQEINISYDKGKMEVSPIIDKAKIREAEKNKVMNDVFKSIKYDFLKYDKTDDVAIYFHLKKKFKELIDSIKKDKLDIFMEHSTCSCDMDDIGIGLKNMLKEIKPKLRYFVEYVHSTDTHESEDSGYAEDSSIGEEFVY
jgi:hypothetical protein